MVCIAWATDRPEIEIRSSPWCQPQATSNLTHFLPSSISLAPLQIAAFDRARRIRLMMDDSRVDGSPSNSTQKKKNYKACCARERFRRCTLPQCRSTTSSHRPRRTSFLFTNSIVVSDPSPSTGPPPTPSFTISVAHTDAHPPPSSSPRRSTS